MFCDAHCDTLYEAFTKGKDVLKNDLHIDCVRMQEAGLRTQLFALWTDPSTEPSYAFDRAIAMVDFAYKTAEESDGLLHIVTKKEQLHKPGIGMLLGIEGGGAIEGSLYKLRTLYRLGVRCMTLTWNGRNAIADGVFELYEGGWKGYQPGQKARSSGVGGLTNFGREVVREMRRLGMLVDLSHIAPQGFWDVCELSEDPVIASHSNAAAICDFPRNLSDEQIKEIIKRNGFIGLNLCPDFLGKDAGIDDILRHLEHMLSLGGEEVVGFGGDFDGIGSLPKGIFGVQDMPKVMEEIDKRYSKTVCEKIYYRNFDRVVESVLA